MTDKEIDEIKFGPIRERADRLAAIRAEIALVSGVVQALAVGSTSATSTDEHHSQCERLLRLLTQERELMVDK